MNKNFWNTLKHPIFALAPMYEVTNTAFRQIIARCSGENKPGVFFTEFVSIDGLTHEKSKIKLIEYLLRFEKSERPIVAQVWGSNPKKFYEAAKIIKKLGFDGIDINMGCPDKAVVKMGAGSALILNPELAKEIVRETKRGSGGLPVSVKTRLGYDKKTFKDWIPHLLETEIAALTIHGRTKKEMSKVSADWEAIGEIAKMAKGSGILILGNGDVKDLNDGMEKIKKYGVDGIMVGRAVLNNPWFFNKNIDPEKVSLEKRLELIIEYAELFEKYFKDTKNFQMVRKTIKAYIAGVPNTKYLRMKLMAVKNAEEIKNIAQGRYK